MNTTLFISCLVFVVLIVSVSVVFLITNNYADISYLQSRGKIQEIIKLYTSETTTPRKRKEALSALVKLATPDALQALTDSLSTLHGDLFNQLFDELSTIGFPLIPYLGHAVRNVLTRDPAILLIKKIGLDAAGALFPLLDDNNPSIQSLSADVLDEIGWVPEKDQIAASYWVVKKQPRMCAAIGVEALPVLARALKDPALVEETIGALGEMHDPAVVKLLVNIGKISQYSLLTNLAISRLGSVAIPMLLELIKSPDPETRQSALNALDIIHWTPKQDDLSARYWILKRRWDKCIEIGENSVQPLIEALQFVTPQNRKDVISTLGMLGHEKVLPVLLESLHDPVTELRLAAVEALGHIKAKTAVEALVNSLPDDTLYPTNVKSLARMGEFAHQTLIDALYPPHIKARERAAEALSDCEWVPSTDKTSVAFAIARRDWDVCIQLGAAAMEYLVQDLDHDQTSLNAARVLVKIGDVRAVIPIIKGFSGKTPAVQQGLVEALGQFGNSAIIPLLEALHAGEMELQPVIHALGLIGDERAARPLANFLSNDYPSSIREAASHALGDIGLPALNPVFEVLRGGNIHPKAAGEALGKIGKPARDHLIKALHSKIYDAQVLVYALGKIPDESAAAAVIETLKSGQYGQEIRHTAIEALIEIGPVAIKPLIGSMGSSLVDQPEICDVLVRFGSSAVDPLIWALQFNNNPFQSEAIVNILGEIGDSRAVNPLMAARKKYAINNEVVKTALEKIWRKQH